MWIEVKIDIPEIEDEHWIGVVNAAHLVGVATIGDNALEFRFSSYVMTLQTHSVSNQTALYHGFLLALQGQQVVFDGIGYFRPLLNERREELHKYMLYLQTINDLTKDAG